MDSPLYCVVHLRLCCEPSNSKSETQAHITAFPNQRTLQLAKLYMISVTVLYSKVTFPIFQMSPWN
jgi:hypothetical protein